MAQTISEARLPATGVEALVDAFAALKAHSRLLILGPVITGVLAATVAMLLPPTFTARTTFLPPQQQQSMAASALAAVTALTALPGAPSIKSPTEQYVALLQSATVANRLIDRFDLMKVYGSQYRYEARKKLAANVKIVAGKKDGLISVDVDDREPGRAAALANAYIEELHALTGRLALTEAQQRRAFFEAKLSQTRDALMKAQEELQRSGIGSSALKAEPKIAAESYASLRARLAAAEVQLQASRRTLTEAAPEIQQQLATIAALRTELARAEASDARTNGPDYVGKYREYKYQETLFDLFARQYELARVDESREDALIQVVDRAAAPERRSSPQRALIVLSTVAVTVVLLATFVIARRRLQAALAAGSRPHAPAQAQPS
jgi:uncharacterized protein involved in exopolysaccharide biosynthesis